MAASIAAKHWESPLAGLAPCHFPRLGPNDQPQKRPMTVKVNLEQSPELQKLSAAGDQTLPATLRAAWALLLRCYTDSEDVCFGYQETGPIGGSGEKPGSGLSGIPVARLAFGDDTALAQLVEMTKGEYAKSLPHHASVPAGAAGRQLFNTILQLRTATNPGTSNGSIVPPRLMNMVLPEECRVRVLAKQVNGSLALFLEWWSSDMTMDQALDVASTFDKILGNILTRPNVTVRDLDCFSKRHLKQILKWNSSHLDKVDRCIHEVIQDQVLRRPDAQAVCAWDGNFTFRELDQISSRLASRLVELGVGAEVKVPLCFDKSVGLAAMSLSCELYPNPKLEMVYRCNARSVQGWWRIRPAGPFPPNPPAPRIGEDGRSFGSSLLPTPCKHASNSRRDRAGYRLGIHRWFAG
ncbi:hypothetical protein VTO42DRAFT_2897 [Malbranchea cinnamomea]